MGKSFKKTRKILSLVLATLMVFSVVQTTAFAKDTEAVTAAENITDTTAPLEEEEIVETVKPATTGDNTLAATGQCGDNVYWTFDEATGLLTISGTGKMYDYSYSFSPFHNNSSIKSVAIESGVTSIGNYAFYNCTGLKSVTIGNSVTSIGEDAFADCSSLTSVTIGNSVTSIGYSAFYNCTGLTSIEIPDSVTSIGMSAFSDCTGLTNVTIPDSVTSIGDWAFHDCGSLTSIDIPDSVTSIGGWAFGNTAYYNNLSNWENDVLYIGNYLIDAKNSISGHYSVKDGTILIADGAFRDCSSITSVTIPDSVTSIDGSAFDDCSSLTSVTIGNSVTSIGNYAFSGCNNLETVYFNAKNCTTMGSGLSSVFNNCTKLSTVAFGEEVTSIPNDAFAYCTGLTSVTIPDSVTSIGNYAFYNCTGLTSIEIPDSVTSISMDAFLRVKNVIYHGEATGAPWGANALNGYVDGFLVFENEEKKNLLACSGAAKGEIQILDSVTSIGDRAFYGCTSLTSITIPDSVTSIGWYAFEYCTGLTSVTIGNSVTSISRKAFCDCFGLTSIEIPDSVTSIDSNAFECCTSLTSVTIGNSVASIGYAAFEYCAGLTSVTIPDSVTSIGNSAFYSCKNLATVYFNAKNCTKMESYGSSSVFYNCTKLSTVVIGKDVTNIPSCAFYGCTGLTSITIPDSVTSIGYGAFYGTGYYNDESNWGNDVLYIGNHLIKAKTSISGSYSIKDGTKLIADQAFEYCAGLTSVTIPDSVTSIGSSAFSGCNNLATVYFNAKNCTNMGSYGSSSVFYNCTKLSTVVIGKNVTNIPDYAFNNRTGLTSVTIPDSVTSIGKYAFYNCSGLTSVTIPDSVTSIGKYAFYNCSGLTSIAIPDSVTSIGEHTFYNCKSLTSVTIGNSVTSIGYDAFYGCSKLTDVYYASTEIFWKKINIVSGNNCLTNATIHFNSTAPDDDQDTEYDSYQDSEEIKEAVGTYTFISGTLNKYTMAVVLDSNESPWVSDVTINGTKYDTSGKKIFPYHIDGYEGKTVVAAMKNNKIEWVRPVSSYVYGAFIEIVEPESFWYSPDDKKYTSETTQTVKVKVSNLLTNDIDMPSSPGYAQSIFETSTFRSKIAEHLNSKGIGALNLKKIQLTANNSSIQIVNATQSKDVSIKFGDTYEYSFTINAAARPALMADAGSITTNLNAKITLSNGTSKSADKSYFSIKNTDYKTPEKPWEPSKPETGEEPAPLDSNTASKQAAKILEKKAVTLDADASQSLGELITDDQRNAIANILYTEVAMFNAPKATFEETLSTKLIDEVFKCNTNCLVFGEYDITCTFQVKTKWGPIQVQFKCSANDFKSFGYRFAFNGTVTYKIVSGAEKLPNDIQTEGFAGALAGTDMKSFCNAVWSVAQSELKSAYNTAWGNDFNKAADLIFGKSVNKVLKLTKYGSASGLAWKLMTTPATSVKIECPVDVFVYDAENNLVASIVNDEVKLTNEDVIATVENGTKQLQIFIEGYKIEYVATANSTMDITVERYGSSDGLIDTTEFVDVPLKVETTYLQNVDDAFSADSNLYLLSSDGETILSDSYSDVFHDHVSDGVTYHTEAPTCIDEGKAWGYCTVCNDYYILNVSPTTDHSYGEWTQTKAATCTDTGEETRTCTVCNASETRTISANGHTEGEWVVTVQPTTSSEGTKELLCSVCGATMKTESIPKLTEQDLKVKSVSISDMTLGYRSSAVITPTIDAVDGAKYDISYKSNSSAVSVDQNGRVTSNKTFGFIPGSAVITVTVTDSSNGNSVSDTCTVTVQFSAIQWIIKILLFGWIWY